jgi:hypothetical protein
MKRPSTLFGASVTASLGAAALLAVIVSGSAQRLPLIGSAGDAHAYGKQVTQEQQGYEAEQQDRAAHPKPFITPNPPPAVPIGGYDPTDEVQYGGTVADVSADDPGASMYSDATLSSAWWGYVHETRFRVGAGQSRTSPDDGVVVVVRVARNGESAKGPEYYLLPGSGDLTIKTVDGSAGVLSLVDKDGQSHSFSVLTDKFT